MTLPATVTRHHTAWVHCSDCRPAAVRYSVDGDRLVCFGDELPADATDGRAVFVNVHEIAGGPALAHMHGRAHVVEADDVDPNAVVELLDHVSLGRTADQVAVSLARHRQRRIVALLVDGGSA